MPLVNTLRRWWGRLTTVRGNPENPAVDLHDDWDVADFGGLSASGERVNRHTAYKLGAFKRGVTLIADAVGKLPCHVYKIGEDGGKTRDKTHPAYRLVRRVSIPFEVSAFELRRTLTAHAITQGNGYGYIYRRADGRPLQIVPLNPDRTTSVRANGRVSYVTSVGGELSDKTSELRRLDASDVIHIHGLGFDGLTGYSAIEYGADEIGGARAAVRFASLFFKNSATPKVVLQVPGRLSESAYKHLLESWQNMKSGLEDAHKTAILEEGAVAQPLTINARDAQMVETREFDLVTLANWLNLPPHKLGASRSSSYGSLESEQQSMLDESFDPWFVKWEGEYWEKLLTEDEKASESHDIEFVREALVRANLAAQASYYRTALGGAPWMTRNEVRRKCNLNPIPGGDVILDPLNMTTK
jgi:HK97 family phage portal protein